MFFQMSIEKIGLETDFPATILGLKILAHSYDRGSDSTIKHLAEENVMISFRKEFRKLHLDESVKNELLNFLVKDIRPWNKFSGKTLEDFLEFSLKKDREFIEQTWIIQNIDG